MAQVRWTSQIVFISFEALVSYAIGHGHEVFNGQPYCPPIAAKMRSAPSGRHEPEGGFTFWLIYFFRGGCEGRISMRLASADVGNL